MVNHNFVDSSDHHSGPGFHQERNSDLELCRFQRFVEAGTSIARSQTGEASFTPMGITCNGGESLCLQFA